MPPTFATIARIADAFGVRFGRASTTRAWIATVFARNVDRAVVTRWSWWFWSVAMIFAISDQGARTGIVAFRSSNGDAFLARTQMMSHGVARIRLASVLRTRAFVALTRMRMSDATFTAATGIRFAMGDLALAFQTWTRASIYTVFPFVLAAPRWFGQRVFCARIDSVAAALAFVEIVEIVIVVAAAAVIELDAFAARHVVRPTTLVSVTTAVMGFLAATTAIATMASGRNRFQHQSDAHGDQ